MSIVMEKLIKQITNINNLSKDILFELNKKNPSFGNIREIMIRRQDFIDEFGTEINRKLIDKLSKEDKETFKSYFDEFLIINDNIKDVISEVLKDHKTRLSAATKQRKAEEEYNNFVNPKISYFQKN